MRLTRRRWGLAAGLVLILGAAAGAGYVAGRPDASTPPAAVVPPPAAARPSELYASDGTTLIARFDAADPGQNCLTVKHNDWGFYCDYLVSWWARQAGLDHLRTGGYRIVGSLDAKLQAAAAPRVEPVATPKVFSVVTVEPGTGLIRVMAVNRAYGVGAQPSIASDPDSGSYVANQGAVVFGATTTAPLASGADDVYGSPGGQTFEPFTLAAALEQGVPLSHTINTKARYTSSYLVAPGQACNGEYWCPSNPDGSAGKRDMWQALAGDVTTYFVPLEEQVGADRVIDLAQRLGIRFNYPPEARLATPENAHQWGGFTLGISHTTALDLATAYATLAADGTHCDPRPVRQITDPSGHPVTPAAACTAAVPPDVARATLDAARCPVGDRPASGDRCGGTEGPASGVRDVVGRPAAGVFGLDDYKADPALVVAGPQLVTAGLIGDGAGASHSTTTATRTRLIDTVTTVQANGLKPLPTKDFPPPSRKLTGRRP